MFTQAHFMQFCFGTVRYFVEWVPEKIHTPPTDGQLEILAGGGGGGLVFWKSGEEGGSPAKKSPSGVIFNHSATFLK